ncbi:hypothetical protein [uncultured Cetobacterium sp.]|uniref:hypothetical protein n=1 Tax=uncultured Cetobacterium sp. TaxID=527638 RepID=UPI0026189AB9|nr:hypothetical protein [uncultured Cetobacterium sp.]
MRRFKIFILLILLIYFKNIFSNDNLNTEIPKILPPKIVNQENSDDDFAIPEIKKSGEDIDGEDLRYLEKTYTVMVEAKVDVFIPLEVVSDINIEETIIGNQIKEIPFEIELNRTPEKKDYYSIKYSETVIDIDMDGKPDTYIYSPKYINEKISKDNYVKIYGEKITKEGTHRKKIYVTVEVGE